MPVDVRSTMQCSHGPVFFAVVLFVCYGGEIVPLVLRRNLIFISLPSVRTSAVLALYCQKHTWHSWLPQWECLPALSSVHHPWPRGQRLVMQKGLWTVSSPRPGLGPDAQPFPSIQAFRHGDSAHRISFTTCGCCLPPWVLVWSRRGSCFTDCQLLIF